MDRLRRPRQRTLSYASKKGIAFYTMPLIMFLKYIDCKVLGKKGIPTGFKGFAKRISLSFFRGIKSCRKTCSMRRLFYFLEVNVLYIVLSSFWSGTAGCTRIGCALGACTFGLRFIEFFRSIFPGFIDFL